MKTAVIYYSYGGNCALIAQIIKSVIDADVFEIKTLKERKITGFFKYVWGGSQVVMKKKPALQPLSVDCDAYDLIILGSPVWASSPNPAIVSFLTETKISGKRIALFCCKAGANTNIFEKFRALLPGNTIAGEIDFVNPVNSNKAVLTQKISKWINTLNI